MKNKYKHKQVVKPRSSVEIFISRISERVMRFYVARRKLFNVVIYLAIFACALSLRVTSITSKHELHSDEVYSLAISTCDPNYNIPLPDGEYSGDDLKNRLVASGNTGMKGTIDDLVQLWHNNGDAPHASLYYMALRVALTGLDCWDVERYICRGGALNLLFFCLSFYVMLRLLRRIFGRKDLVVYAGLAVAFLNVMSVRNTMMLREYQMAETAVLVLTFVTVGIVQKMREGRLFSKWRTVVALSLSIAAVISLGYFNAFYVAALCCVLCVAAWRYKRPRVVTMTIFSGILAVAIAWLLYSGFFMFILYKTPHQTLAFRNFSMSVSFAWGRDLCHLLFTRYGYFVIVATLIAGVVTRGTLRRLILQKNFVWLPLIVLLIMPLVQYASVLKQPRYYFALMPILMLIVPQVLTAMSSLWRSYFGLLIVLFFSIVMPQVKFKDVYAWQSARNNLATPVAFYRLNPNELMQLTPNLDDHIIYTVANKMPLDSLLDAHGKAQIVTMPAKVDGKRYKFVGKQVWAWDKRYFLLDLEKNEDK